MNRRRYLAAAGIALSPSLVGCLGSADDPANAPPGTEPGTGSDSPTRTPETPDDEDGFTIDGRLYNEADDPRTFTVATTDADGNVVSEEERTVGPNSPSPVPALGKPGGTYTYDVRVGDASASKTLAFDVEPTPGKTDGYVDVTYTWDGDVEIEFTSLGAVNDGPGPVEEDPRVDAPPHDIQRPDPPESPGDEDAWNDAYLGEHMDGSPSLEYDVVTARRGVLATFELTDYERDDYWVQVIGSEAARDALLNVDAVDEGARDRIASVDFDESVLVAVETGWGSGSIAHRWARVEDSRDAAAVHLHGYYTDPYVRTDDITTTVSLLAVARPADSVDLARVSLTVNEDTRVHFNSTEGVVTLDDE